ncbi:conjugal transfer protein TraN [Erythrobacter sp. EC-HK427]
MPGMAQSTDAARADGKETARDLLDTARDAAARPVDADRLPGYNREGAQRLEDLAGNPDRIASDATAEARRHEGYQTIEDSLAVRARFEKDDLEAVVARSFAINAAPGNFTSGMAIAGSEGNCVPLPPGSASAGYYTATCNTGVSVSETSAQCRIPLIAEVSGVRQWHYLCREGAMAASYPQCSVFDAAQCRVTGYREGPCLRWASLGGAPFCAEPGDPIAEITCDAPQSGQSAYAITDTTQVDTQRDESLCRAAAQDPACSPSGEICVDDEPSTRTIAGVAVTRSCWEWERSYSCSERTEASDCAALDRQKGCRFVREECLTGDIPCATAERIFECPLPPTQDPAMQYICDGDIYCIDGSCETIARTANDEFKDAVVALNAMDQARGEFSADTLSLFTGTRNTCSSKVFGVLNCCKGKGFPLIPGIGLLVTLGCDREEVLLHERDAQGLCAFVGTYCTEKILGVCTTKRKTYCCFESKLSRILQEEGRKQLPKPWKTAQDEDCAGFTLEEFARLDLSRMDFSEVFAEFTAAARLPDELEASTLIQQKIEDFYARSNP